MKDALRAKSQNIKNLIEGVVNETIDIPDNALVFLDYDDLLEVFTRKRLELVRLIDTAKPSSLQELAKLTRRKKQAINRDLRILERQEVLKLEKNGRNVVPKLNKKVIMIPLSEEPISKKINSEKKGKSECAEA